MCPDYNDVRLLHGSRALATFGHIACYASGVNGGNLPLAFIFDLDGVLVHSMPLHTRAWEEYLANLGITVEDLEKRMHG